MNRSQRGLPLTSEWFRYARSWNLQGHYSYWMRKYYYLSWGLFPALFPVTPPAIGPVSITVEAAMIMLKRCVRRDSRGFMLAMAQSVRSGRLNYFPRATLFGWSLRNLSWRMGLSEGWQIKGSRADWFYEY